MLMSARDRRDDDMSVLQPVTADLATMSEFARDGIVSKSVVENDHHKIILFALAAGQELSEHTASVAASIHIVSGAGTVTLAGQEHEARPGMLYYMPAELRHAIYARDDLVFLLTMFRT
jgi:quercetin dioxygenase-like cupin family protein